MTTLPQQISCILDKIWSTFVVYTHMVIMVRIDVYVWRFSVYFVNPNSDRSDANLEREYPPSENISNKNSIYRKGPDELISLWVFSLTIRKTEIYDFDDTEMVTDMVTSSNGNLFLVTLAVLCAGNSPVIGEFPTQRSVTRSFDGFFDLRLNKRLSKHREAADLRRNLLIMTSL